MRLASIRLVGIGIARMRPNCMGAVVMVGNVCLRPRPIPVSKIIARYIIAQQGSEQRTFESNYSIKKSHVNLHKLIE
jgi:NO-binding membrane sensor protein with MHYT domain